MPAITYTAPKTCARFMRSTAFGRLIAGPVGSGKTTACIFELFRRACEQAPAADGYRYTRFAIVRQTLKQLKDTVLKDVTTWLNGVAEYKVSENTIYVTIGDVKSEWLLIPLDTPEDQRRLLSMQLTGAWMSEAIEIDLGLVSPLAGRCGRYPGPQLGGASWFGIIADTNMPVEGSDWYKFMEVRTPPDWQIFKQPSGMSPLAENLEWLTQTPATLKLPVYDAARIAQGRTYYERFLRSNSEDWCRRYVHAEYGIDPSGLAVFRDSFRKDIHVVDELYPLSANPLIVGMDFGRDPCAVICQMNHKGQLLVLEEVIAKDIGLELQINAAVRPALLQERYLGRAAVIIGDPSGVAKSSIYEETTFDVIKRMGFMCYPAPTNDIDARIRAIDAFLLSMRAGAPGMLIDGGRCPVLVQALQNGYRFDKLRSGETKVKPAKNEYSHVVDAFQYACLAGHSNMVGMISNRMTKPRRLSSSGSSLPAGAWT